MHSIHREKLFSLLSESHGTDAVLISGAAVQFRYGTDHEYPFRQESNFQYLTGIWEPDFKLLLDVATREYHLFTPKRDAQFAVWHGFVKSLDEIRAEYQPDHLHVVEDLPAVLARIKPKTVHVLWPADASFVSYLGYSPNDGYLSDMLAHCRVIKSEGELELMRRANRIASAAHDAVKAAIRPGMFEYEVKALFEYECQKRGSVFVPYNGIHGSGTASAILHYTENHRQLNDGDLYLIDAGAEVQGYAADLTRTWAINGNATTIQKEVYAAVLRMQTSAIDAAKPGVAMEDLQLLSARVLMDDLSGIGLVRGTTHELMEQNIFALFFPHGLGHFLGLDTHDPGGYPKGVQRIDRPGLRYLRARRTLETGMVVTIEPGCYFIPALLEPAFANPAVNRFLNVEKLTSMLDFGGIRIEDNLIITPDGNENLTTAIK
jgi:Xaa-Pro dipeptidase